MSVTVFEANYAKATYEPDKKRILLVWDGSPTEEEYKAPFNAMLKFAKIHPVDNMVSDISKQGVINPNNRKWFENEMMPQAIDTGMKRAAIVTSGNVFKLYYVNLILSSVNKFGLPVKLFKNQQEAGQWLDGFMVDKA